MVILAWSTTNVLDATVELDPAAFLGMTVTVEVTAESPNYTRDIVYVIDRKDICGNGLRWGLWDACDDGNVDANDGCTGCVVDPGW